MRQYVSFDTKYNSTSLDSDYKIILTEVENYINKYGQCYVTNAQLGELLCMSVKSIDCRISHLRKLNLIECHTKFINKRKTRFITLSKSSESGSSTPPKVAISSKEEKESEHPNSASRNEVEEEFGPILENTGPKKLEDPEQNLLFDTNSHYRFESVCVEEEETQSGEFNPFLASKEELEDLLNILFKEGELLEWKQKLKKLGIHRFLASTKKIHSDIELFVDAIVVYDKKLRQPVLC